MQEQLRRNHRAVWLFVSDALHQLKAEPLASGCTSSTKCVCFGFTIHLTVGMECFSHLEWALWTIACLQTVNCRLDQEPAAHSTALSAGLTPKYYFWQWVTMVSFPSHRYKMLQRCPKFWEQISHQAFTSFFKFFSFFNNLRKNSKWFASWDAMVWSAILWSTGFNNLKIIMANVKSVWQKSSTSSCHLQFFTSQITTWMKILQS